MIVDKSWFMFDTSIGSLVLQRLGFFSDNTLKRTTNSSEIWRNILHSDKIMNGEILMVLLEWTIHGNPSSSQIDSKILTGLHGNFCILSKLIAILNLEFPFHRYSNWEILPQNRPFIHRIHSEAYLMWKSRQFVHTLRLPRRRLVIHQDNEDDMWQTLNYNNYRLLFQGALNVNIFVAMLQHFLIQ